MKDATFLTTAELADLLRIKERKVYDLVATGTVPHTKATGKTLFPREGIQAWLSQHAGGPGFEAAARPPVLLGSHDPLLERAVRQSGCGLAMLFDGSHDGLDRYAANEGIAAGIHIRDSDAKGWNTEAVSHPPLAGGVLIEWCRRSRGLMVRPELASQVTSVPSIAGLRAANRQPTAATHALFASILDEHGLTSAVEITAQAGTEADSALALLEDRADVALGLAHVAASHGLHFVPVLEERYDLYVDRKAYFDTPFQAFLAWCTTDAFKDMTATAAGYDFSATGTVHFNSA